MGLIHVAQAAGCVSPLAPPCGFIHQSASGEGFFSCGSSIDCSLNFCQGGKKTLDIILSFQKYFESFLERKEIFYSCEVSSLFSPFGRIFRRNQKVLPCPGWDSTPHSPPWRVTTDLTMDNPRPVPVTARLWVLSTL